MYCILSLGYLFNKFLIETLNSFLSVFVIFIRMNRPNDNLIQVALSNGTKKAFEQIYNEFFGMLFHLCIEYTHDEKVAEEIVQDTFLKLWEIRETLNDQINIRNLLYTITKNYCLNYLRNQKIKLKHHKNLNYLEMQFNYDALEKLGNYIQFEEIQAKIDEAISKLPTEVIETFRLSRFEEMTYKEIAFQQGISIKTVEARISKALRILRVDLKYYLSIISIISNFLS